MRTRAPDRALYVMAGFDEAAEARLENLQKGLLSAGFSGRQATGLFPHVTLGCFPVDEEPELRRRMEEAARRGAFEVAFRHAGIFAGGEVLFVAPDVDEELLKLRRDFEDGVPWTPHVTMLIADAPVVSRAVLRLMERFEPFCGRVNRICLYEFQPSRHILTVNLGGAKTEGQ